MENLFTLVMLILLQAVLGVDNLLYISLESKNAPAEKQNYVRKLGIGVAIVLRIALLFILVELIKYLQDPLFGFDTSWVHGHFNVHSLIVLAGGGFIVYTAIKEIWHMIGLEEHEQTHQTSKKTTNQVLIAIIIMNVVFSFDSILSAIALTDVMWVMITAIVIGGVLMIWLAEKVSNFLKKNRMYEVLGLFILFLVGVMLLSEAGHLAHLAFFGHEIVPMNKATFYFVIVVLFIVDIIQNKYQQKISAAKFKQHNE